MPDESTVEIRDTYMQAHEKLYPGKVQEQEPNGFVVIRDGKPPQLIGYAGPTPPSCCNATDRTISPPRPSEPSPPVHVLDDLDGGIRIFLQVSYRFESDTGLVGIVVFGLDREGGWARAPSTSWWPTPAETENLRTQVTTRVFSVCFPCPAITEDYAARFQVTVFDEKRNQSTQIVGIRIGRDQFKRCCH